MPDLWMDVDAALGEVPVNILPLLDDTDFKTRETAVAFNAAGMDLVWNFVTPAGAFTQTAVTPTSAGDYDWTHQGDGMYTIEIPSTGGASINNNTEGFGWFTGVATGVLPWRGPTIGFRAAGLNDALVENAYSTTRGLAGTALPNAAADAAGGLPISDAGGLDLDAQVGTDIDTILSDTNDIQTRLPAALVSGRMDASVGAMANNVLTAAAINADAFTAAKFAADVTTEFQAGLATASALANVQSDTDDIQTRLPAALVGGRMDSNVGAISSDATAADNLEAALDGTGGVTITAGITGNITGNLSGSVGSVGAGGIASTTFAASSITAAALAQDASREIADEILDRDIAGGASGGARNIRSALRALRNRVAIVTTTLTVYQEDDSTPAWTSTITRTAGVDPITETNPA